MKATNTNAAVKSYGPMIIIGSLFFVFGLVTWVNSVLIPYFKLTCALTVKEAMLVALAFYISYFIMALPSSLILKKTGYKNGMMLGLFIMAAGALIFVPAAATRTYSVFLIGLFIEATGLTLLQTAANPYITILGPIESAASRISIMGICNKIAGAIAPLLLVGAIVRNPDEIDQVKAQLITATPAHQIEILNELSSRLIIPYLAVATVFAGLGFLIKFTHLPDINDEASNALPVSAGKQQNKTLLQHTHLLLGAFTIFCGVGVEVMAIDTIINYAQYTGLSFRDAKYFATYTLLLMILSYCIGIFTIPKFISQRKALMASAVIGIVLTIFALIVQGPSSVWFIALLGLGNAMLWPATWPLALDGLGKFTSQGSALLIMGAIGGGLAPWLYGVISDTVNPQMAYSILIPFYLFIFYYSVKGYKAGRV